MHISTTWGYVVVFAIACGIYLYSENHPKKIAPFRSLFNYVVGHKVSRLALLVIWWWVGWHFMGSLQPL